MSNRRFLRKKGETLRKFDRFSLRGIEFLLNSSFENTPPKLVPLIPTGFLVLY